ncbi:MAG: DUF86 domain-containing protein [Sphingobium sp.]|jgi:uncharacterized protein with HEPN domain|nr:DUF86 domain-containing protein [Sphingobium sp.]MCI1270579.1 DUF86 domain-containing protein [Sphingobium sp.]MCI1757231.1 DUF86 domain-containing protein [Sphingobium sp.]MCI2052747.1 DUF86 domain-containing protein [Sphingobium sp.]
MVPEERDPAILQTILLLIQRIRTRLEKMTLAVFVEEPDDIDLLAYRLSMVGEYAGKLSSTLRARHPEIPWSRMSGLRNIVAHEYLRVTPARLWETAQNEMEPIATMCRTELERFPS